MYGDIIVTSNENHLIKHGIVLLLVNIKLELTWFQWSKIKTKSTNWHNGDYSSSLMYHVSITLSIQCIKIIKKDWKCWM